MAATSKPKVAAGSHVTVGPQGRIVIPVHIRKELGLEPGADLVAYVEDGRLMFETRESLWRRIKTLFAHVPPDVSLADELIAERRAEARREDAELRAFQLPATKRKAG
jgi:AbrB family looped-hinge helix DNA binding protein